MADQIYTQMRIKRSVLSRLQQRGKMGESYTDLVERILNEIEEKNGTTS